MALTVPWVVYVRMDGHTHRLVDYLPSTDVWRSFHEDCCGHRADYVYAEHVEAASRLPLTDSVQLADEWMAFRSWLRNGLGVPSNHGRVGPVAPSQPLYFTYREV